MTETPRQRARIETEAQITAIGNRMIDDDGVDGLSLRAIARELGVVSSAVYRYVKSRDELLTILIRDAFTQIADAVDEALEGERSVKTLALRMLEWSRAYPNRWALIYGTPIAEGKPVAEFDGRHYVLERAIDADIALVHAHTADTYGNLRYRLTARNFNPLAAMCGRTTFAEAEHLVDPGEIGPDDIHTPGVFVHHLMRSTAAKDIEQRTTRPRPDAADQKQEVA